jgi:hypothetical protein
MQLNVFCCYYDFPTSIHHSQNCISISVNYLFYFRKRLNDEQFVRIIFEKEALETGHFVIISSPKTVNEPFYVAQVVENDFHAGKWH